MRRQSIFLALSIVMLSLVLLGGTHAKGVTFVGSTSLYIFGVSSQNGTIVGVPANLSLMVTTGTGQVFLGSTPLAQTDTQAQAVVSTDVACQLINVNCDKYNFYYFITSNSAEIGGPSAGAAFTVAAMSVLTNHSLNPKVAMTGTANPDGSIGIVGDVAEKSMAAARQGIKVFLYPQGEPAQDNMTSSAITYDENLGMVPVPISSVYQAYQYFTGYNITPALKYNITTPLFSSLMHRTYTLFNQYQQNIYASLPSKNSSDPKINSLISTALASMAQQKVLAAEGQYYVAASDIVNTSATDLEEAYVLEKMATATNQTAYIMGLIASENASIAQTYKNVTSGFVTNSTTLDLKLIAIDRLDQAWSFLNQSASVAASSPTSAAYLYALAEVKRASGPFWESILPTGNSNFTENSYASVSNYYLYKAASYLNYAGLLGPTGTSAGSAQQTYFDQAAYYYNSGKYVASIFNSLESIANSQLTIESNSIINGSTSQVSSQISASALRLINSAEAVGITPFLGISYYQFGTSFSNSSVYYYIQFESLSRAYTSFEASLSNKALPTFQGVNQPASVPLLAVNLFEKIAYLVIGFALGVVIGGILYEYRLFRLVKRLSPQSRRNFARVISRRRGKGK